MPNRKELEYQNQKRILERLNLSPDEYEKEIQKILKKLKI